MAPVMEEKEEKDKRSPKMLCQMDNHLGRFAVSVLLCDCVDVILYTGQFVQFVCSFTSLVCWQHHKQCRVCVPVDACKLVITS